MSVCQCCKDREQSERGKWGETSERQFECRMQTEKPPGLMMFAMFGWPRISAYIFDYEDYLKCSIYKSSSRGLKRFFKYFGLAILIPSHVQDLIYLAVSVF